jgi:hypothetical protein
MLVIEDDERISWAEVFEDKVMKTDYSDLKEQPKGNI